MRFLLPLLLTVALLSALTMQAAHALSQGASHAAMEMGDMPDGETPEMECCDAVPGRSSAPCGWDAVLISAPFAPDVAVRTIRHRTAQARAPAPPDAVVPLAPPKG
ncbi:hypothetical protein [Jannaschia rubra]|uniref:hypothetical protein n=1 Tax=Jannaschia rubra TaxID=282197 RepID=UPI00249104EF|nr:hypothetical protein [Jannaschia rubra]